jgi:hypothetical protein
MADNVTVSNSPSSSNTDIPVRTTETSDSKHIQHMLIEAAQAFRQDIASSSITYYGFAKTGTATSAASWKVIRHTTTNPQALEFADGNHAYDNIWDNRASLSYS